MPLLKKLHFIEWIQTGFCIELLVNLSKNIRSLRICTDFGENIMNALVNGNGKCLQELDIKFCNNFDGNVILCRICRNLKQLKN
jgi:hypothetical protein